MKKRIHLIVNGYACELEVEPRQTLLEVIRENLELTGTKEGCGMGECGACTVLMDGKPVTSCIMLAAQANGCKIMTIEGLDCADGAIHPIQQAFVEHGAIQCGFCTPGMILSAKAFLEENPHPSRPNIRRAISGNLCRCTGYQKIEEAILSASGVQKLKSPKGTNKSKRYKQGEGRS